MSLRRCTAFITLLTAIAIFAFVVFALPARAEDGEGGDSVEEQIKKKMQEILRLMEENEAILLRASTGASGSPRKVDVEVPVPPSKGGKGGDEGGASGSSGGASKKGEEVARKMRELIEGQRQSGGKISGEMGKLLKMIPKQSGQGQGQPQDGKGGQKESQEEQQAREARKQLEKKNQEAKKEQGDKSPKDPAKRMPKGGKPEDVNADGSKRDDNVPAWAAALPPEIRDAIAGGRAEDVPAKYRHLVKRYHLWLQRNKK